MVLRKCNDCGLEAIHNFELILFVKNPNSKYGRSNLCRPCSRVRQLEYRKFNRDKIRNWRERNRDYMKNWIKEHPDYMKRNYIFNGRLITADENPRTNICHECGKSYPDELKRQTSIHHLAYAPDNPLAWTVELCTPCHITLHHLMRNNTQNSYP